MRSSPRRALVMSLTDPTSNPRPNRAITLLYDMGYKTHVFGAGSGHGLEIDYFYAAPQPSQTLYSKITRNILRYLNVMFPDDVLPSFYGMMPGHYAEIINTLKTQGFAVILVEDLSLLPLALRYGMGAKIIFDAREFYPAEYEGNWLWALRHKPIQISLCKKYLRRVDTIITVSEGLRARYMQDFGVESTVLRSTPKYHSLPVHHADKNSIKMVHHGLAARDRKLENMVDLFKNLDERFSLDFYLVGNDSYVQELQHRAALYPKIRFHAPLPFHDIIPALNRYDIGLFLLEPTGFNGLHALPNKLFEFIQARLMVAVGPSPDMADVVRNHGVGVVANTFEPDNLAGLLNALSAEDISLFKQRSDQAARILCAEQEGKILAQIVQRLDP